MSTLSMMIESTERLSASVRPSTPPIIVSRTSSLRSSIRQKSSGSHATSTKTEGGQHPDVSGSRDAIEWTPSPRPDNAGLCKRRKHLGLSYDRLKESMSVTQLRPRANEHADQSSTTAKESNNALSVPESHCILGDTKALYDSGKVDELGQQQLSDRVSLKPCEKETGQARNYSKTSRKSTKRGFNTAISKEKEDVQTKRAIWTQIRDALRIDDGDLVSEIRNDRQVREPVKSRGWPCNVAPPPPPPPPWQLARTDPIHAASSCLISPESYYSIQQTWFVFLIPAGTPTNLADARSWKPASSSMAEKATSGTAVPTRIELNRWGSSSYLGSLAPNK